MKKVLFISDQYIFGVIGGSLGHKRFYDILSNDFECEFKIISLDGDLNNRLNLILLRALAAYISKINLLIFILE